MFWLLLAATIAIDAVAVYWLYADAYRAAADTLFDALVVSQISLFCIWAILGARGRIWAPLVPFAAAAVTVAAIEPLGLFRWTDAAAERGIHVAALLTLLWILKRTPWWQRGVSPAARENWQFSLSQLVVVMTVVAVLIAFLRHADVTREIWSEILGAVIYGYILLPVAAVLIWRWVPSATLRLLATFVAAGIFAVKPVVLKQDYWLSTLAFYLIQAPMLWLWLELGQIVTRPPAATDIGSDVSSDADE
jgi:hypothetical protein